MNEAGECSWISWKSNKLKKVVKSVMASETLVLAECWTKYYIMTIRNTNYQQCNTDSRQLHEATLSILPFLDKRLRINIAFLQQMRKEKEIQEINEIDTSWQIANTLTKLGA